MSKQREQSPYQEPIWKVARDEADRWSRALPAGLVMAILFCFAHRLTMGETFEETFCKGEPEEWSGYEI